MVDRRAVKTAAMMAVMMVVMREELKVVMSEFSKVDPKDAR